MSMHHQRPQVEPVSNLWQPSCISPLQSKTPSDPPLPYQSQKKPLYPSQMTATQLEQHYPIPHEFLHNPQTSAVVEPESILASNGRQYHAYKEGRYFLPNDAKEQDRLDLQHQMCKLALDGRLACSPMTKVPKNVLDVATGTGNWAIEFASQNPASQVLGTDLSAIQPAVTIPNIRFLKRDAEEEWLYPEVSGFDYIHFRFVLSCFDHPKTVLAHAVKSLAPGGWLEYFDVCPEVRSLDGSHEGTATQRFWQLLHSGFALRGRDPKVMTHYKEWMTEAKLVDVVELKVHLPANGWPDDPKMKRIGQYCFVDWCSMVRGLGWPMILKTGLSAAEAEKICDEAIHESEDEKLEFYYEVYVVYQKPLEGEV